MSLWREVPTRSLAAQENLLYPCYCSFSWGRWKDILTHGRFKWHLNEKDMEMICRALLVYCVKHYKGDEKIKSFIWDLITPTKDGQNQALQNHSGIACSLCHCTSTRHQCARVQDQGCRIESKAV